MPATLKIPSKVETIDWMPTHDPLDYPSDFVSFIDSINEDWREMETYRPFELYKAQAAQWSANEETLTDYRDFDEQTDFLIREFFKCQQNTLYAANKFGHLKEGDFSGGEVKYKAWEAQSLMLFLADSRYNIMAGKGRQIGFTSTMGLLGACRINFNPSYFVKFITHSIEKGEEIFRDKIQWSFSRFPDHIKQNIHNFSLNSLTLRNDSAKGEMGGFNSMVQVVAPNVGAINGGSPNLVLVDEIGMIEVFGSMMREGRPTLFYYDPIEKKMKMRRQFIGWGTGAMMDKAGHVFEAEYKAAMEAWQERNFIYGIVPVFFNAYAREGLTEEIFKKEQKVYYSIQGVEAEKSKVQFHMHYPMTYEDMFLKSAKTLLPMNVINEHLLKIYRLNHEQKPQYGYFEPVYDKSRPTPDLDTPYKIVGSTWIPTGGQEDPRTACVIFKHPEPNWIYRYYQGTDPINSETGHSKMSSAIWDAYTNSVSAVIFHRDKNFKESYLQCLLMGLYYEPHTSCKELIENNIGDFYFDYKETKGFGKSTMPTSILPPAFHIGSGKWWGISNKANTAGKIMGKLIEMLDSYVDNIYIPWFFLQMKTFIEKTLASAANASSGRQTRYQAADLRYNYDDVIFSVTFAYMCAQAHAKYEPIETTAERKQKKIIRKFVSSPETNFTLRLAEVDENGKVIRFVGKR